MRVRDWSHRQETVRMSLATVRGQQTVALKVLKWIEFKSSSMLNYFIGAKVRAPLGALF